MRAQCDEENGASHPEFKQILRTSLLLLLGTASVSLHAQFNQVSCVRSQCEAMQAGNNCTCARFIRCHFGDQSPFASGMTIDEGAGSNRSVSGNAVARALPRRSDFNRSIYYKNKFEFSLQTGWLPTNIPFVFDFLLGAAIT